MCSLKERTKEDLVVKSGILEFLQSHIESMAPRVESSLSSELKAKKRGASRDTHASSHNILVANSTLAIKELIRIIIIRGHIRACVLAIDLGFVTRRGFCTLCLIIIVFQISPKSSYERDDKRC